MLNVDIAADNLTKPFIKDKYKAFKKQLGIKTNKSLADRLDWIQTKNAKL